MLRKTIVAGAVLLAATFGALSAASVPAQAKTNVHFGFYVGVPGPVYYDPWPYYWAPGVVYVPGYYYYRPYYRRVYRWKRVYYRPRWRQVCVYRKVKVRYWNGQRWRWRTVRKGKRCRWVRR